MGRGRSAALPCALILSIAASTVRAEPLTLVALGASNTSGWGVGERAAYPARLETMLRERGLDVRVVNAGRPFDTTAGMRARLGAAVPAQAALVVIQPGGNDLRFFGTPERRAANIDAMVADLTGRGIRTIVYDPVFPPEAYQWDRIHINAEGHARIAEDLLPQVLAVLRPPAGTPTGKGARRQARRPDRSVMTGATAGRE